MDWLEEADRQLYLTTATTGNHHDCRQRRRIDFVLVYSLGIRDSLLNKQRRQAFQHRLKSVGFEIEEQDIVGGLVRINGNSLILSLCCLLHRNQDMMIFMRTMK